MRDFVGFGRDLGEFEPGVLRPEHPGVFGAHLAGISARSRWHFSNVSILVLVIAVQ